MEPNENFISQEKNGSKIDKWINETYKSSRLLNHPGGNYRGAFS